MVKNAKQGVRSGKSAPKGKGAKKGGGGALTPRKKASSPAAAEESAPPQPADFGYVGLLISRRRRSMHHTLQRVANMIGCAKSYLWLIERGRAEPSDELLVRLQHALGFKEGELQRASRWAATPPEMREALGKLQRDRAAAKRLAEILSKDGIEEGGRVRGALDAALKSGELKQLVDRIAPEEPRPTRTIGQMPPLHVVLPFEVPLINSVAAGYPREFTDLGYPARVASEYVRCPDLTDTDAFATRVVGDSMMPEYREGDIVVFSPARVVKSGMDCFARIEPDQETTFKRVFIDVAKNGEETIRLQPLNDKYPTRTLPREQIAGLYAAVSVTRKLA